MNYKQYLTKFYKLSVLAVVTLPSSCAIFSFSGNSLGKAKTFSIENFYNECSRGFSDLKEKFTSKLEEKILKMTKLKEVYANGDIKFEGTIKDYKIEYANTKNSSDSNQLPQGASTKLTVTVEIDYTNRFNSEADFTKKRFRNYREVNSESNFEAEEATILDEIFEKIIQDIFRSSIHNW